MLLPRQLRLLLLWACWSSVWVTTVPIVTQCDSDKYVLKSLGLCCNLCPAGYYVSMHCDANRNTQCSQCKPGTFTAHPNSETSCLLCTQCREDQEVVISCSSDRDQQCQCQNGTHYCDSVDCVEKCYRCTRCKGATLYACNATRDTVCAAETVPDPGHQHKYWFFLLFLAPVLIGTVISCRYRKQGVHVFQRAVSFLKRKSYEPGSHSCTSSQSDERLQPMDAERRPPALGVNTPLLEEGSALAPGAGTRPGPSEDPEEGIELQVLVRGGDDTAPEQPLQTHASAACGPPGRAKVAASLRFLEQSCTSSQSDERLQPMDAERRPPALGVNTPLLEEGSALAPGAGTGLGPSEDPEEGIERQVLVRGGGDTALEQPLQTHASAACGPQGRARVAASLRFLEQEYKQKYFLKDTCDATNRIYYEFGHNIPESDWKMFMRFVGLEENDIEICEHENPSNVMEQHHKMLLKWRNKLGREASVFKLMAALHKMELHVYLENIINRLVAENILGKHAETPN